MKWEVEALLTMFSVREEVGFLGNGTVCFFYYDPQVVFDFCFCIDFGIIRVPPLLPPHTNETDQLFRAQDMC